MNIINLIPLELITPIPILLGIILINYRLNEIFLILKIHFLRLCCNEENLFERYC